MCLQRCINICCCGRADYIQLVEETDIRQNSRATNQLKITLVGDGNVGKTCLINAYKTNSFNFEYAPTVYDDHETDITVDGIVFNIKVTDTGAQEEDERLISLCYKNTDCFIFCCAVNNRTSFANILTKWYPDITDYIRKTKQKVPAIIVVGNKCDLLAQTPPCFSSLRMGQELQTQINAFSYMECSAMENLRINDVFETAIRAIITPEPASKFCIIL